MTSRLSTKKALIMSLLSMLLCVSMLVGSTFAWFTDTASTAVNTIQAGTLDVALEMKDADGNWVTAEGRTLNFKTADNRTTEILWEPGCTYELPALRIVNKGNLALKFKVVISGINGDAKLNEAIEWTIGGVDINAEGHLAAGANSNELIIKGHMREDAGNEYQGLRIDGIAITVYATQDTVEKDSHDDQYDKDARYFSDMPIVIDGGEPVHVKKSVSANGNDGVLLAMNGAKVTVDAELTAEESDWTDPSKGGYAMAVWAKGAGTEVTITDGYYTQLIKGTADQYDLIYASGGATIHITGGVFKIAGGDPKWTLNVYDGDRGNSVITVAGGSFYKYNPATDSQAGEVVVANGCEVVKNGDWYSVIPKAGMEAQISGDNTNCYTLAEAVKRAAAGSTVTLVADTQLDATITVDKEITIDGVGHTITFSDDYADEVKTMFKVNGGTLAAKLTLKNAILDGENKALSKTRIIYSNGTLVIDGSELKNFNGTQLIKCEQSKGATIMNTKIHNNNLTGIQTQGSNAYDSCLLWFQGTYTELNNVEITDNHVLEGKGILIYARNSGTNMVLENVTATGNTVTAHIFATYSTISTNSYTFKGCTFKDNQAQDEDNGFFIVGKFEFDENTHIESNIVLNNDSNKNVCTLTNNGTIVGDIKTADWAYAQRGCPVYTGTGTHTGTKTHIDVK